jgi:type IV pilus assembly protein PilC
MGLFSSRISTKAMVQLCRQLATSYSGGIPIIRSLDLVAENVKDRRTREVLAHMRDRIQNGATLAEAGRSRAEYLPPLFIELLASGEVGGKLDAALRDLANYYEDRLAMQRTILRKSAYPALQLTVAWFLGTFALMLSNRISFVSAKFSFSGFLRFYVAFQAGSLVVFCAAFFGCVCLARLGVFRWVWGWVATYVWPLSAVTMRFAQARFFRALSVLIGSGVPIVRAIERAAAVAANPYLERDLLRAVPKVKQGCTLVESFGPSQFLGSTAREMLRVGEESGRLEEALNKVAQYQMEEAVHAVNLATRVGEVVISLGVAIVVGYVVISFYVNYYGRMMNELRI